MLLSVSKNLFQSNYQELVFNDLASAVGSLTEVQKDKLMDGLLEGQELKVGQFLHALMTDLAKTRAETEATNLMLDDNLTLIELQRIF